jgi:hypothetical protein
MTIICIHFDTRHFIKVRTILILFSQWKMKGRSAEAEEKLTSNTQWPLYCRSFFHFLLHKPPNLFYEKVFAYPRPAWPDFV